MPLAHLGAREAPIQRELDRLRRARWLRPDAELESLDDDARTWLSDRFDELLAALTPWAGDRALPSTIPLRVTRSMHEAERLWREAWERPGSPGAVLSAIGCANGALTRALAERSPKKQRAVNAYASNVSVSALSHLSVYFKEQRVASEPADARLGAMVTRHLEWTLAFDDATPSPDGPLLAIAMRGAWPLLLPGDEALVYVPVEHEGRPAPWLEGDPIDPQAEIPELVRHGPRHRPVAVEECTALPAWWQLALPIPITFTVERYTVEIAGGVSNVGFDPPDPEG